MFELETIVKAFANDADRESDVTISLDSAREIIEQFKTVRTALRRIVSLEERNVPKYAQQIAHEGLRSSHS